MELTAVGIPWYRREEYDALRASFEDGDGLHDTFDEWIADAEKLECEVLDTGVRVLRVYLSLKLFRAWCAMRNLPLVASSRARYATEIARRRASGGV